MQRTLGKIDGVSHAEVTLRPGVATVVTDPARPVVKASTIAIGELISTLSAA